MALTDRERRVCKRIEQRRDELIELVGDLIIFETTARKPGQSARDEPLLQRYLATRMRAINAEIDLFEPDPAEWAGRPLIASDRDWSRRPQLIATHRGAGQGKTLVLNGHIDVGSPEPRGEWHSDPWVPTIRDGKLYGCGACDMKGGIAAMAFAAETLAQVGVVLAGDLVVATHIDEKSTVDGAATLVAHGLRGDAAIVPEPTDGRIMLFELDPDEPIVAAALRISEDLGQPTDVASLDSSSSAARLTRVGGIPCIACGPPGPPPAGRRGAHTVDEFVSVAGLVACAQKIAVTAMRFCDAE